MKTSPTEPPSAQLQTDLEASTQTTCTLDLSVNRPILKHLNADSSWLLSLPYTPHTKAPPGRCRYNIVIDPWLRGPQVDLFSWFSSQEHAKPSAIQSLSSLNDLLSREENTIITRNQPAESQNQPQPPPPCFIDAVVCSHEFTDHCHEATLRELPSTVPVFAPKKAATLVRSWKHFDHIEEVPVYASGYDWRASGTGFRLPSWIGLGRIHTRNDGPIYFHSALMITFSLSDAAVAEAILYTPHGVAADSLSVINEGAHPVTILALLHGLHDISLAGAQLNLGMRNAIRACEILGVRYWTATHDEAKIARGVVGWGLRRVVHTLPVALGSHPVGADGDGDGERRELEREVSEGSFVEVGNGGVLVLV